VNAPDKVLVKPLLGWYAAEKRDLPWRKTKDPYAIWISEVMLQQTTVPAVVPYFERWLKRFPAIRDVAAAPLQSILKSWQGLGYYQRARNIHDAARTIVENYGGKIPRDAETLSSLPGFGPYTTAAVLSLGFGKPCPVLDANVRRVMMRMMGLHGEADGRHDKAILAALHRIIDRAAPGDFNQAMMELGALVCRQRNPLCAACPAPDSCRAFDRGEQEIIPKPKHRTSKKIKAVVGIIRKGGRILIQQRPKTGLLAGLWEFPGGKVRRGETLVQALRRELKEELDADLKDAEFLVKVDHSYTQYQVALHAYAARLANQPALKPRRQKWVGLKDLRRYPVPSGSARIIRFLERR
jgi:A/G-specific adenine glycosylase